MDSQYEADSITAASHIDRKLLGSISELEVDDEEEDEEDDEEKDEEEKDEEDDDEEEDE